MPLTLTERHYLLVVVLFFKFKNHKTSLLFLLTDCGVTAQRIFIPL